MPDAQGTASFIGEFLKGYMGQTAQAELQKLQKVQGLISISEKYRQQAEDPDLSKEEHDHWKQLHTQTLMEADKTMNQKSSGLGSIMKALGFGKKQANGSTATPTSDMYRGTGTPASMPRPESQGPAPADTNAPAEFMGPNSLGTFQQQQTPPDVQQGGLGSVMNAQAPATQAAPAAPATDPYAGIGYLTAQRMKADELKRKQDNADAIDLYRQQEDLRSQKTRSDYTWQQSQTQAGRDAAVEKYKASPEFKTDSQDEQSRVIRNLQYGLPYREPTQRLKTERVPDANGNLVERTIDLNDNNKVVNEVPYTNTTDEPYIQAIINQGLAQGKNISRKDAEAQLGSIRLKSLNLTNQGKESSLANQASMIEARKERDAAAKKAKSEGLSQKEALSIWDKAMAQGKSIVTSRMGGKMVDDAQIVAASTIAAKQWLSAGGLDPNTVISKKNGTTIVAPQQRAGSFYDSVVKKPSATTPSTSAKPIAYPK
jgi:hypothetical protein